jgi:spermidine synthase
VNARSGASFLPRAGLLVGLYGISGLAGVAYEVLWARLLSLQFGISVFGVVITVAAFMAGLGIGSLAMAGRASRVQNPLRLLAWLEGGVAVFSLLLPWIARFMSGGIDAAAAGLSPFAWQLLMAAASFLLLTLPACALGAGLPLLLSAVSQPSKLGLVYGVNTLGAVAGALLPLALLPWLGWSVALRAVALTGLAVSAAFAWLGSGQTTSAMGSDHLEGGSGLTTSVGTPPAMLLLGYGALGAVSLALEMAWTRLFGLILLRTEYVLALILAVFLTGIGLGSLAASRRHSARWASLLPWCAAGFVLLGLRAVPWVSAWVERSQWNSLGLSLFMEGAVLLALTLPVTLVLGAWLPILARQSNSNGLWLYGANSLGAACGALLAGFVLIPWIGTTATVAVTALAMLLLGLTWNRPFRPWTLAPLLLAGVVAYSVSAFPPAGALLPQSFGGSHDLYRYEDAIAITQVVEQADGQRVLLTDLQRRDASTDPTAVFVQGNQARLPLLLHPNPRSILFVGLGTGISDAGSAPYPNLKRKAVELSHGAILAAKRYFAPLNQPVLQETTIRQDDARHFLIADSDRYDVIVGDLFHPDLAGVSSLLSVQQFQRARDRLAEHGLFVQWVALNQFDPESLDTVLRSFQAVFPQAQLFLDGMHLALVGPRDDWSGAAAIQGAKRGLTTQQLEEATSGEGAMTWMGRYWGPITVARGPMQDEWAPVIEFRLPRVRHGDGVAMVQLLNRLLAQRPSMERAQDMLQVPAADREAFQRAYAGTELLVRSWMAGINGQSQQSARLVAAAYEANPRDRWTAWALTDLMLANLDGAAARGLDRAQALQKLLQISPWQADVLRALWHEQLKRNDPQAEATRLRLLSVSPLDREARSEKN